MNYIYRGKKYRRKYGGRPPSRYQFTIIVDAEPLVTIRKCLMCSIVLNTKNGSRPAKFCSNACKTKNWRLKHPDYKDVRRIPKGWAPSAEELEEYEEWKNKQ